MEWVSVRYKPAVPRYYLFAIAGVVWTIAGAVLCLRAGAWLAELRAHTALVAGSAGISLGAAGYAAVFLRVVKRNILRIVRLPEHVCIFAFTAWRGYFIIAFMMAAGFALRHSSLPHAYLAVPYLAMGGVLLTGSIAFYREFVVAMWQRRSLIP